MLLKDNLKQKNPIKCWLTFNVKFKSVFYAAYTHVTDLDEG